MEQIRIGDALEGRSATPASLCSRTTATVISVASRYRIQRARRGVKSYRKRKSRFAWCSTRVPLLLAFGPAISPKATYASMRITLRKLLPGLLLLAMAVVLRRSLLVVFLALKILGYPAALYVVRGVVAHEAISAEVL